MGLENVFTKKLYDDGITVITGFQARDAFRGPWDETEGFLEFPENSLHPMEQVKKGEGIVSKFVETKHPTGVRTFSPEILQSLNLYCKLHHVPLHVYVTKENGGYTEHSNLDPKDDFDEAFESFATSFDFLMKLRSDLENPNDDNSP